MPHKPPTSYRFLSLSSKPTHPSPNPHPPLSSKHTDRRCDTHPKAQLSLLFRLRKDPRGLALARGAARLQGCCLHRRRRPGVLLWLCFLSVRATIEPARSSTTHLRTRVAAIVDATSFLKRLHLHGRLRVNDNLYEDWFTVFLLFQISDRHPTCALAPPKRSSMAGRSRSSTSSWRRTLTHWSLSLTPAATSSGSPAPLATSAPAVPSPSLSLSQKPPIEKP